MLPRTVPSRTRPWIGLSWVLCALAVLTASSALAQWPRDPTVNFPVCDFPSGQGAPQCTPDGAGGIIVAWYDTRGGANNNDIYAQHILQSGRLDPAWPADGLAVCTAPTIQGAVRLASDGAGGAFVIWVDARNGLSWDLYAHHVLASGVVDPLWPADGLAIAVAANNQWDARIVEDGAGGAFVVWEDYRAGTSNADVYAHHLLPNGTLDPLWPATGLVLCGLSGNQENPEAVSDGMGGFIATWGDRRTGNSDIYAQRVNASGSVQWAANGVAVCVLPSTVQIWPNLVSDGTGGAIVTWEDWRNSATTGFDIFAHHVLPGGTLDPAWPADGLGVIVAAADQRSARPVSDGGSGAIVTWQDQANGDGDIAAAHVLVSGILDPAWSNPRVFLCQVTGNQADQRVVSDGAGGAIVVWWDLRLGSSNPDIYARRILANGLLDPAWPANGLAVCTAPNNQYAPWVVPSTDGDAIVVWTDARATPSRGFAQRLTGAGFLGSIVPAIASVRDVPGDQGGKVRVLWEASAGDAPEHPLVGSYRLWRKADVGGATYWEFVTQVPAKGVAGYGYTVSTAQDSSGTGVPWNVFYVSAVEWDGVTSHASPPDSGYSVDNLSPLPPSQLTGTYENGSVTLTWRAGGDPDVAFHRLYRGDTPDFAPAPQNLVAEVVGTTYTDHVGAPPCYKLTAVDVRGNESAAVALDLTGGAAGPAPPPASVALSNPRPNPSREGTWFEIALPRAGHVSVAVFDAGGRSVRVLLTGELVAGTHALAWDGADEAGTRVAPGLYFVRLEFAGERLARRLMVLR